MRRALPRHRTQGLVPTSYWTHGCVVTVPLAQAHSIEASLNRVGVHAVTAPGAVTALV